MFTHFLPGSPSGNLVALRSVETRSDPPDCLSHKILDVPEVFHVKKFIYRTADHCEQLWDLARAFQLSPFSQVQLNLNVSQKH
jgi:hypothetical protein